MVSGSVPLLGLAQQAGVAQMGVGVQPASQ